jgi:hypothetical protein
MRVGIVLLAMLIPGCTVNFVRKPAKPELVRQQIEYFKWLYEKGFYRSDPEMMRKAASKLLDVSPRDGDEEPSQTEALERVLHQLEDEIKRLSKEKR